MSITYNNTRYEPDGRLCAGSPEQQLSIGKAIVKLVRYEFGYGGRITQLESTHIIVRTSCMGFGQSRYDIVEFRGTEEEMKPLLAATAVWYGLRQQTDEAVTQKTIESIMANGLTKPIEVAMMSSLMHHGRVPLALCAIAGLTEEQAENLLKMVKDQAVEQQKNHPRGFGYRPSLSLLEADAFDPLIELILDGNSYDDAMAVA